jgi:EAL domain-containing protein (putative c-di-GMP-specific phosphodiesterase class I)
LFRRCADNNIIFFVIGLFIPLAEQTSLISDIGRIVIQQTAKQITNCTAY